MNYGLYLAASGLMANQYRQDVVANNMANVNTVGFKPDFAMFRQRNPERIEDSLPLENPNRLLEKLGGGVFLNATLTRHTDGALTKTKGPLDLAIQGEGYFGLTTGRGDNDESLRFTRDGRLALDADGYLVHAASGMKVIDINDRVIRMDTASEVNINSLGEISQNDAVVARLQFVNLPNPQAFKKVGQNSYKLDNNSLQNRQTATGKISQGWLESSAVNPISALMELNQATSAISANSRMIRYHDELMDSAINRLGRVT